MGSFYDVRETRAAVGRPLRRSLLRGLGRSMASQAHELEDDKGRQRMTTADNFRTLLQNICQLLVPFDLPRLLQSRLVAVPALVTVAHAADVTERRS